MSPIVMGVNGDFRSEKESETFSFQTLGSLRQWAQILGMESQRDSLPSVLT